ncbi:hypothetical protein [Methyloversatilis thermotolerans]|uniref:hypothetical protein n=1 Tax=Methyloversatilis thermotolerans TaxID=1346290 RepID=UPI0012F85BCD|nr:hypothetical protein [Methyloversatilis thermotolerans]
MMNKTTQATIFIAALSYSTIATSDDKTSDIYNDPQLSQAIKLCKNEVEKYEKRAQSTARFSFWSAFVGATTGLLGSALAGHASTATVAVLSGTAGVTNGMQQQLNGVGYDQEGQQRTRNEIVQTVGTLVGEYAVAQSAEDRRRSLIKITFACDLYKTTEKGTGT